MKLQPLIRTALLALLCMCPLTLFAAIGTIDSLEGDVRVVSAAGDRAAKAGMEVNEGDTVKTGDNAWALLAMADGASMTLRQRSQLRLDTYRYDPDGDPSKNSSVLSLFKGAFRSITGYIGRTNRDGYRITTPTATIGIRGTDHEPAYYPPPGPGEVADRDPGTYDKVNDGESFIRNPKGEIAVKRGQYAFVHHNRNFAPRLLARPPAFYQRHADLDRRAAKRRQEFHRVFEERHQRRLQERRGGAETRKEAARQQHDTNAKKQGERGEAQQRRAEQQQQRREVIEQRQHERQAAQEGRKQERLEAQRSRREERAHNKDAAEHEDEKKEHGRRR